MHHACTPRRPGISMIACTCHIPFTAKACLFQMYEGGETCWQRLRTQQSSPCVRHSLAHQGERLVMFVIRLFRSRTTLLLYLHFDFIIYTIRYDFPYGYIPKLPVHKRNKGPMMGLFGPWTSPIISLPCGHIIYKEKVYSTSLNYCSGLVFVPSQATKPDILSLELSKLFILPTYHVLK